MDHDACGKYKDLLDEILIRRRLSKAQAEAFSEVIISAGFNDLDLNLTRFNRTKEGSDAIMNYFKLKPKEWEKWNRDHYGEDRALAFTTENPHRVRQTADWLRRPD